MIYNGVEHLGEIGDFANSFYSPFGEDGIIEEVFRRLEIKIGTCMDLFDNDGISISCTRRLYNKGWTNILIPHDSDKTLTLEQFYPKAKFYPHMTFSGRFGRDNLVLYAGSNTLEFLNMDLDSYCFGLSKINPALVMLRSEIFNTYRKSYKLIGAIKSPNLGKLIYIREDLADRFTILKV